MNACRLKAPDGELNTAKAYAYRPNEKEQGKLKVVFGDSGCGGDCKFCKTELFNNSVCAYVHVHARARMCVCLRV